MQAEQIQPHEPTPSHELRAIAARFLDQLERAWNSADGAAFAAPFIEASDLVDIRGALLHGRVAIAEGHDFIFSTIYKGSAVRFVVLDARLLAPNCMLFHSQATLVVPGGPVKGVIESTQTIVAVRTGAPTASESSWRLAAFHNTVRP